MTLKIFFKNLKYLYKNNLKNSQPNINDYFDNLLYEIDKLPLKPKIKNNEETIQALLSSNKSICRFGDGELQLINNKNIPFQKHSPKLTSKLIEVLSSKNPNIMIAIPNVLYTDLSNLNNVSKNFWRQNGINFRPILEKYIDFNCQYYSAEVTLAGLMYNQYNHKQYFDNFIKIFSNQNISLIANADIFKNIEYNILDCAKSLNHIHAPKQNAFDDYEKIVNNCQKIPANNLILIALGPTATLLAYDFANKGYRALDIGHIIKSFDFYMKNIKIDINSMIDFFKD